MKSPSVRWLLYTFVPATAVLLGIVIAATRPGVGAYRLTADIASIAGVHPFSGILSSLSVLVWCAAGCVSAFAAASLGGVAPKRTVRFLWASAGLSAYLVFDDLFLAHEFLAPEHLGLDERVVYAVILLAVAAYVIGFRDEIARTHTRLLYLALGFLAASAFVDVFCQMCWPSGLRGQGMAEDALKWLGIVSWCSYQVKVARDKVGAAIRDVGDPADAPAAD